jgi:hypothetical protein
MHPYRPKQSKSISISIADHQQSKPVAPQATVQAQAPTISKKEKPKKEKKKKMKENNNAEQNPLLPPSLHTLSLYSSDDQRFTKYFNKLS